MQLCLSFPRRTGEHMLGRMGVPSQRSQHVYLVVNIMKYNLKHKTLYCMVGAGIIERKLRSTKVRLFTVPCCSIILFSSEGVKKKRIWIYPNFFRRSIILVGALLFYNSVFPQFSHISHFRSIINVSRAPFYNLFFRRTEKLIIERKN